MKVVNPGSFSNNYELYTISTPLTDYVVKRKQLDFFELREYLVKRYPGYMIPPLPKKINKKFIAESMKKYMRLLQLFLNDLLDHPLLRETKIVHSFLTIQDEKVYAKVIKELVKKPLPKEIAEFTTKTGTARVTTNRNLIESVNEITAGSKTISSGLEMFLSHITLIG